MGVIGRYIDGLNDEARDRIVSATHWCTRAYFRHESGGEMSGCLLGHALNAPVVAKHYGLLFSPGLSDMTWPQLKAGGMDPIAARYTGRLVNGKPEMWKSGPRGIPRTNPAGAFNQACERFGMDRTVRAIKLRAASAMSSEVEDKPFLAPARATENGT